MLHQSENSFPRCMIIIIALACIAALGACGATSTITVAGGGTSSATTTSIPSVTITPSPPTATPLPPTATPRPALPAHLTITVIPSSFCSSNPSACTNPLSTLCTSGSFPSFHLVDDGGQSLTWHGSDSDGSSPPYNTNPVPALGPSSGSLGAGSSMTVHLGTSGFVGAALNVTFNWTGSHMQNFFINCLMP
jgi:hypothetical protein